MNKKWTSVTGLILLSLSGFVSYYAQVLLNGWEGLKWLGNFYWSFVFLPLLFCIWLKLLVIKTLSVKQTLLFLISYVIFFVFVLIHIYLIYNGRLSAYFVGFIFSVIPYDDELTVTLMSIVYRMLLIKNILVITGVCFAENLIVTKIFKLEFTKHFKILIFFLPAIMFLAAWILMTILYFLGVFPGMNLNNLKESIHIFKTGTIIFTTVLGEGLLVMNGKRETP